METKIKYEVGSDSLQRILLTSMNAESSYDQLMTKTSNKVLLDWIGMKKEFTTDFILKVLMKLEEMEIAPKSKYALGLKINQFFENLRSLITAKRDELVIRECLKVDSLYLKEINEVLKSATITDELYQLYTSQKEKIRMRSRPVESFEVLLG